MQCSLELLINTAITAPKAGGRDDVIVSVVSDANQMNSIFEKMREISKATGFGFYERDASTCENIDYIIFVCAKAYYHNYNCGYCGFSTCEECMKNKAYCALTITDCGIAMGSLVKLASILGIDNRIMLSLGRAAIELGIAKDVFTAYGIPLSVGSKSVFFDRKY